MWLWSARKEMEMLEANIEKLKAFRDIGETFNYLGRKCVVTGHYEGVPFVGYVPRLKFDYVDDQGIVRSMYSTLSELPALIKQQEEPAGQASGI